MKSIHHLFTVGCLAVSSGRVGSNGSDARIATLSSEIPTLAKENVLVPMIALICEIKQGGEGVGPLQPELKATYPKCVNCELFSPCYAESKVLIIHSYARFVYKPTSLQALNGKEV